MNKRLYFVGIDFGHGETTISKVYRAPIVPGGPDQINISPIAIRDSNNVALQKIITAVCKKDGKWAFVENHEDYKCDDLREGFKGMVRCNINSPRYNEAKIMSPKDNESMKEFAKLIFEVIKKDGDISYNSFEDRNFILGIACPSDWVLIDEDAQKDYLEFFREECGLPVDICIKESDAAFFTKFANYAPNDTVFVIDIGSSTIDFTTYSNKKCMGDLCWGANLGAHIIDDIILGDIMCDERNKRGIEEISEHRRQVGYIGDINTPISLYARQQKESYYSQGLKRFSIEIRNEAVTTNWEGDTWDCCVRYSKTDVQFESLISGYKNDLKETLISAKNKLSEAGITPNYILLSGGASRMPFVKEFAESIFNSATIDKDKNPEYVVSNGIALYEDAQFECWKKIEEKIQSNNFNELYIQADRDATKEATTELFPPVLNQIQGSQDLTGNAMYKLIANFFLGLNQNNAEYVKLLNKSINETINRKAYNYIKDALYSIFRVEIEPSDVKISIQTQALSYHIGFFQKGYNGYDKILDILIEATGPHIFTPFDPDKKRDSFDRADVARLCKERLCVGDPFGVGYDKECLNKIASDIEEQCISEAKRIFIENELFNTTFKS